MKEIGNNQPAFMHLPPPWCSSICRNNMNEVCIEHCAIERDCSGFEPKKDLKLEDMPRFPLKESMAMTKEERFIAVTIYLAKVVDHLQGVQDEHSTDIRRSHPDSATSGRIPSALQKQDLLLDPTQEHSVYKAGSERQDQEIGPDQVAQSSNREG